MNLNNLNVGENGVISSVAGDDRLKKRLMALGCLKGTNIELVNKAPLGDPLIISFRGTTMALRKKDAINIHLVGGDN